MRKDSAWSVASNGARAIARVTSQPSSSIDSTAVTTFEGLSASSTASVASVDPIGSSTSPPDRSGPDTAQSHLEDELMNRVRSAFPYSWNELPFQVDRHAAHLEESACHRRRCMRVVLVHERDGCGSKMLGSQRDPCRGDAYQELNVVLAPFLRTYEAALDACLRVAKPLRPRGSLIFDFVEVAGEIREGLSGCGRELRHPDEITTATTESSPTERQTELDVRFVPPSSPIPVNCWGGIGVA